MPAAGLHMQRCSGKMACAETLAWVSWHLSLSSCLQGCAEKQKDFHDNLSSIMCSGVK